MERWNVEGKNPGAEKRNRGMRAKKRRASARESKTREREREKEQIAGRFSHAREHMLGGGTLRRRSALKRTGQDGLCANGNDGEEAGRIDGWIGWMDRRTSRDGPTDRWKARANFVYPFRRRGGRLRYRFGAV